MPDDPGPRPDSPGPLKRIGLAMAYALPAALIGGCNFGMVINDPWRCDTGPDPNLACFPATMGVTFGLWLVLLMVTIAVKNIHFGKLLMVGAFAAGAVSVPLVFVYLAAVDDGRDRIGSFELCVPASALFFTAPMLAVCWRIGKKTLARMRLEERGATDQLGRN